MSKVFLWQGYSIYFWSHENGEPIHVHISKRSVQNATKIWILRNGEVRVANNNSRIPEVTLRKLCNRISRAHRQIVGKWTETFKGVTFIA